MSAKKSKENFKAYMGANAVFQGTLNFEGTVRIDGKFKGKVITDGTLVIGETGELAAEITAGTVVCKGKFKGVIRASKGVEIHGKSELVGNIKTPSLYIEAGAVFDGNCDMLPGKSKIIKLTKNEEKQSQTPA